MPDYKRKTDAEREAINERARNWKRPPKALSIMQRAALTALAQGELGYTVAGFQLAPTGERQHRYHSSQTVLSLASRKLCTLIGTGKRRRARITPAGRRELER